MSTFVKGDKIKIPTLSEDYTLESDLEGYDIKIHKDFVLNVIQNSIAINIFGQTYTKSLSVDNEQEGTLIVLNSSYSEGNVIVSISLKSDFKDEEYYHFMTSMLVTDNIFTPNWNAQQGEAGYIENKPFYMDSMIFKEFGHISLNLSESEMVTDYLYSESDWSFPFKYGQTYEIYIGAHTDTYRDVLFNFNTPIIINVDKNFEGMLETISYIQVDSFGSFQIQGEVEHFYNEDEDSDGYRLKFHIYDNTISNLDILIGRVDFNINKLPNMYIDGVVKTTPQSLSNTDKNQALANLGINEKIDLSKALKDFPITIDYNNPGTFTFEDYGISVEQSNIFLLVYCGILTSDYDYKKDVLDTLINEINTPNFSTSMEYLEFDGRFQISYEYIANGYDEESGEYEIIFGYTIDLKNKKITITSA